MLACSCGPPPHLCNANGRNSEEQWRWRRPWYDNNHDNDNNNLETDCPARTKTSSKSMHQVRPPRTTSLSIGWTPWSWVNVGWTPKNIIGSTYIWYYIAYQSGELPENIIWRVTGSIIFSMLIAKAPVWKVLWPRYHRCTWLASRAQWTGQDHTARHPDQKQLSTANKIFDHKLILTLHTVTERQYWPCI